MGTAKNAGARAPVTAQLTPEGLRTALIGLEPSWTVPTIEAMNALIDEMELLLGFVKRRQPREKRPRTARPVQSALRILREAAERQMRDIQSGALLYAMPDLKTHDEAREAAILDKLRGFLEWYGTDDDETAAVAFGELPGIGSMQSWHGKARMWAPRLASAWRPLKGLHPLHGGSSFVRVLHGLLIANGEIDETQACTRGAVCKFLRENKDLLRAP